MKRAQWLVGICVLLCATHCGDDGDKSSGSSPDSQGGSGAPAAGASAGTAPGAGSGAGGATAGKGGAGASNGAGAGANAGGSSGSAATNDDAGMPGGNSTNTNTNTNTTSPSGRLADGTNPNAVNPYPNYKSDIYSQDKMWMCKPGLAKNYCLEDIADATEALPDGTFKPFMDNLSAEHPFDCIFWYPTVNRTENPTSLDFSDPSPMLGSVRNQAARFSRICNVYAPFYRQVSLNNGGDSKIAYQDVVDGFKHYIANWNKGRYFIIFGHSQGTGHATKLISDEVNDKPELRERLISALLIGGGVTPTTFSNIPVCSKPDQFGCVVGYRTYGKPTPPTGTAIPANLACVNPAALMGGHAILKGSFFNSKGSSYAPALGSDFTAHWGLFRNFFSGECKDAPGGGKYLEIDYTKMPGDKRDEFLNITREYGFGLHVFDYAFLMDDLLDLVDAQSKAMAKAKP